MKRFLQKTIMPIVLLCVVKFVWDFFEDFGKQKNGEWGEIADGVYEVREGVCVFPSGGHIIFTLQITNKDKINSFVIEHHGSSCETGGKLSIDKLQLISDHGNVLYEFPNLHLDPSMIMKSSDLIITDDTMMKSDDTMMKSSHIYLPPPKLGPPSNPQKLPPLPTLRRTTGIVELSKTILDATKTIRVIPHCTSCTS